MVVVKKASVLFDVFYVYRKYVKLLIISKYRTKKTRTCPTDARGRFYQGAGFEVFRRAFGRALSGLVL